MDTQLVSYSDNIERDYDRIAAHAISFAEQLESGIQKYLTKQNYSFEELKNNPEALFSLQNELYNTVYLNMQLAPSSGAFYILDSTVNSQLPESLYNGIYLKYINLNSENTVNNSITLYRGSYSTGKNNGLTFHSGWQNEMKTDFFDCCESEFTKNTHYILSSTVEIPDTWERARYVYVPLRDMRENIIGVCGYEVNDLYFQLSEKFAESKFSTLVGALLESSPTGYSGQFNSNRYKSFDISTYEKDGFTVFSFDGETCIGRTRTLKLGKDEFIVALMITETEFEDYIRRGQLKVAGVILFVVVFAFAYCLSISKKYVSPILKKIEQIKANEAFDTKLNIHEIDNLITFLAEKDAESEEHLRELETAKKKAEEEAHRTREAYEKALEEYKLAQSEIHQLSNKRKKEIVLEDFEFFLCNLKTLTPTEYRVYELYVDGKSSSEIATIMGFKENTLKYHNKNIYSKLGISSRKQLLRFATLKQHNDKKGNPSI
ncbi:MAG: LuxR C-terminal-related transcriptional regulator [Acutalibacteraceae bacterium]|nr:LuxR C-terminal-related transcriptional regulator [Acutalibacteraceae bacterium]